MLFSLPQVANSALGPFIISQKDNQKATKIADEILADFNKKLTQSLGDPPDKARLVIYSNATWGGSIQDTNQIKINYEGEGNNEFSFTCSLGKFFSTTFQSKSGGYMIMVVIHHGQMTSSPEEVSQLPPGERIQADCGNVVQADIPYGGDLHSMAYREAIWGIMPSVQEQIQNVIDEELENPENKIPGRAILLIYAENPWSGFIQDSSFDGSSIQGKGHSKLTFTCQPGGIYSLNVQHGKPDFPISHFSEFPDKLALAVIQDGQLLDVGYTEADFGIVQLSGACKENTKVEGVTTNEEGGGCLIATATYGSELATQVQQLRELRDNTLLHTNSGTSFMTGFNQLYYSFSPTIADVERENPLFKEVVKLTITPLLTSLSILNYVDINSEEEMLGYGISLIMLNVGMYFVAPAILIHSILRKVI